jgi:DUF2934 family protein
LTWKVFRRRFAPKEAHAMNTDLTKKLTSTATNDPQELEHLIRVRAYELYEARGRKNGHELDDWLRAKEEIREKKFRTATA